MASNTERAWEAVREVASHCTRCHLYKCATQTVFGEGPVNADILFVGERVRFAAQLTDRHHLAEQRPRGSGAERNRQWRTD